MLDLLFWLLYRLFSLNQRWRWCYILFLRDKCLWCLNHLFQWFLHISLLLKLFFSLLLDLLSFNWLSLRWDVFWSLENFSLLDFLFQLFGSWCSRLLNRLPNLISWWNLPINRCWPLLFVLFSFSLTQCALMILLCLLCLSYSNSFCLHLELRLFKVH